MLDFRQLAHLSDEELGRYDIVETHLACAAGLPGAEKIDQARCIAEVNRLTEWVRRYTDQCLAQTDHANEGDNPGVFRMRAMFTCLWKGAKIRYNPAKIPDDSIWTWEDSFLHTALFGEGGTCATLPVLYTAIGRRLGYPLKLVESWGPKWCHLFCRWDDPAGERFNAQASATGTGFHSDDHFRRHGQDREQEKLGRFMISMSPREELAGFLITRAHGWREAGRLRQAVDSFAWAASASPENFYNVNTLKLVYNEWQAEVERRKPAGFPAFNLGVRKRRYPPGLPLELEGAILCVEAQDNYLNFLELPQGPAGPHRQGRAGTPPPRAAFVDSWGDKFNVLFRS